MPHIPIHPVDIEWVAVGGADIYRGHNPVEVDGHDEFAVEFAKQVIIS